MSTTKTPLGPIATPVLIGGAVAVGAAAIWYFFFSKQRIVLGFNRGKPSFLTVLKLSVPQQNGDAAWLRADAAQAFEDMRAAAARDGVTLAVSSAFRSVEAQAFLYAQNRLRACFSTTCQTALPGYSNHQQGTTLDVDTANGTNAAYRWLVANAKSYGFCRTVPHELHHWEFNGKCLA